MSAKLLPFEKRRTLLPSFRYSFAEESPQRFAPEYTMPRLTPEPPLTDKMWEASAELDEPLALRTAS
ncbi:hypothetical protein D3C75_1118190 [compost metagenome]